MAKQKTPIFRSSGNLGIVLDSEEETEKKEQQKKETNRRYAVVYGNILTAEEAREWDPA